MRTVGTEPPEAFLARALDDLAGDPDPRATAAEALAEAEKRPDSPWYGVLHMLAGAAAAAATPAELEPRATFDAGALVAACDALQDEMVKMRVPKSAALTRFGALARPALDAPDVPRFLDMRVATDADDTVFYWLSGVMALRASSR